MLHATRYKLQATRYTNRAQALVEVLVAISVLTVGFVGVITLLARSLGLNRVVADNYTATYLAGEGIEVIKNMLDYNAIRRANGVSACWNEGMVSGNYEVEHDTDATAYPLASISPGSERIIYFDSIKKLFNYDDISGVPTVFHRRINIATTLCIEDVVVVHSIVSWTSRGGSYLVDLEDHFYNWR